MPTILDQLTSELRRDLSWFHRGVSNETRPGEKIRKGDKIGFTIHVRNNSGITIKNIRAAVYHTAATIFPGAIEEIPRLLPGEEKTVRDFHDVKVVADTDEIPIAVLGPAEGLDLIARVDATAEGDLASLRFTDVGIFVAQIFPG